MEKRKFEAAGWEILYTPEDGGRLNGIKYKGYNLLSSANNPFVKPQQNLGRFETRPVYGYDDCFPSVTACFLEELGISVPDHGELCWLPWNCKEQDSNLIFCVKSELMEVLFSRILTLTDKKIIWTFQIENDSEKQIPFLHAIHPLLPLNNICSVVLPDYKNIIEIHSGEKFPEKNSLHLSKKLVSLETGQVRMYFLHSLSADSVKWKYDNGLEIEMIYPIDVFPHLGIWWDKGGYPQEKGLERFECAFEPVASKTSDLKKAIDDNDKQVLEPKSKFEWSMVWRVC